MTLKQFTQVKMTVAFLVAIAASNAIITNNYLLLAIAIAAAALAILVSRSRLTEVMADERDYALGGTAARWSIQIHAWLSVLLMLVLYSQRNVNPAFEPIATTLAYSTCLLMLLYAFIFRYHQRVKFMAKKKILLLTGSIILLAAFVFGIRLLSGEDNWICQDGRWVEHGHPDFPAPQTECK